jgi:hypothetical protein
MIITIMTVLVIIAAMPGGRGHGRLDVARRSCAP